MKQICFSIVIPTLNEERFLPKLLNSIASQKEKDFEVIIVDGQSADNTQAVASSFKKSFPVKIFEVKKRNVAYQRNYGAEKAKGEYLLFLDADSKISKNFLFEVKKEISKTHPKLLIPYLTPDTKKRRYKIVFKVSNFIILASHKLGKPFSAGGSVLIEKELFLQTGGFDEEVFMGEDHDLVQKACSFGIRAKILKKPEVTFSLRRRDKEGNLRLLYKYILATIHIYINGRITHELFNYEMGGQLYSDLGIKKSQKSSLLKLQKFILSLPSKTHKFPLKSFITNAGFAFIVGLLFLNISFASSESVSASINSYKKYGSLLVARVMQPVKAFSVVDLRLRFGKKNPNQILTTGFITA